MILHFNLKVEERNQYIFLYIKSQNYLNQTSALFSYTIYIGHCKW